MHVHAVRLHLAWMQTAGLKVMPGEGDVAGNLGGSCHLNSYLPLRHCASLQAMIDLQAVLSLLSLAN